MTIRLVTAGLALALAILAATAQAGPAWAATIVGTSEHEVLFESNGDDTIYGRGGIDYINADIFIGIGDRDVAYGNRRGDEIDVDDNDGKDTANGGNGKDACYGDPNDQYISCETIVTNPNK
jgi:hypothetical protein